MWSGLTRTVLCINMCYMILEQLREDSSSSSDEGNTNEDHPTCMNYALLDIDDACTYKLKDFGIARDA